MIPFSVLDLSPITEGSDAGQALRNSLDLARHVEALGYQRYWMAEHHNLPGIASAATAVALAHVAAGTTSIRIGAGGIMLPNHAPLLIAEQFGTLAALHPGRLRPGRRYKPFRVLVWTCRSGSSARAPLARSSRRIWACLLPSLRISRRQC
jgi:hypothetical protein